MTATATSTTTADTTTADTTTWTSSFYTSAQIAQYKSSLLRDGFVLIPSLLSESELSTLRGAAASSIARARAGKWPYIRTVPKQFPPWPPTPGPEGIWGVQHLLHPSLPPEEQQVYAHSYFTGKIMHLIMGILGCREEDMVMELYNMLVTPRPLTEDEKRASSQPQSSSPFQPTSSLPLSRQPEHGEAVNNPTQEAATTTTAKKAFTLRWHRDDIPASASAEEELARLSQPAHHAQWNLALYPDSALVVVPGSHKRARTEAERQADLFDGEDETDESERESQKKKKKMPGQIPVTMQPGDVVFYNNNILHRGVYDRDAERATLHGSVGVLAGGDTRARNVLQHGVGEWVDRISFGGLPTSSSAASTAGKNGASANGADGGNVDDERKRAETMRRNLVMLGRGRRAEDVGFSLEG